MIKFYKNFIWLWGLPPLFLATIVCSKAVSTPSPFSLAALTWNMGNTTVKDGIVDGFVKEIKALGSPDVIMVGTQEELAKNGEELKDKVAQQLKNLYEIKASNAYATTAGANNSPKTLTLAAAQNASFSKKANRSLSETFNLPQNRCALAIFVKKGIDLTDINMRIDYPPGTQKSNNAFILVEGTLKKEGHSLPISIASVHLNSKSDPIRRSHANSFFDNQKFTDTSKKYGDILKEAKRFHLVMGDFNERDYLMKDNTVTDRGRLTNFTGYGYDFSAKQGRPEVPVYGTYGYTKFGTTPEAVKDPRGRKHNAKGGFLDRIAITSGLAVDAPTTQYGALITDKQEFDEKKKLFYAGSDHLPILRYFTVSVPDSRKDGDVVKGYIKRRLPDFTKEIEDIGSLIQDKKHANKFIFYDSQESPIEFIKNLGGKKEALEGLQSQIENLKGKIDGSDQNFLSAVYNKITECNKGRNMSLEKMDDNKRPIKWYVPNSLGQDDFKCYQAVLANPLKAPLSKGAAVVPITSQKGKEAPQKNSFSKHAIGQVKKKLKGIMY